MTRTATLAFPASRRTMPVIDPRSLTRGQQAGRRCAIPNCRRLLADLVYQVGRLLDGRPVLACEECAPAISYEVSEESAGRVSWPRRW